MVHRHMEHPGALPGPWRAVEADETLRRDFPLEDLDDGDWPEITVPGAWRSTPAFAGSDGPLLYRTRFTTPPPDDDRRTFLEFAGVTFQGDVWLDGSYLGPTEGSFIPHLLEATAAARARTDHLLAVEATCSPIGNPDEKRTLTGTTQGGRGIPSWNPGGIGRPVRLRETGPIPLLHVRVLCTRATEAVATLALRAVVHTDRPRAAVFHTRVLGIDHRHRQPLAGGENRVEWSVRVPRPPLWWPAEMGDQPLHDVDLEVTTEDGRVSDRVVRRTGFRSVRMRDHVWSINGERLFLRGAVVPPMDRDLSRVTARSAAADLSLARDAGLNLLRMIGHVSAPDLYAEADRTGMLLWQDLPLTGGYHRGVRGQAARQARDVVDLLGHHPSVVVWCGHDAPDPVDRTRAVPRQMDQQVPTWNRTVLDRTVRRALEQADPSRPVISHSGVLPNPPRIDDAAGHLWFGWYSGRRGDLAGYVDRVGRAGRFVSAFGAQSVPEESPALTDGTLDPDSWPAIDVDRLVNDHGAEADVLLRRFPPADRSGPGEWAADTRRHQDRLLRIQIEALRRRKYRPTGGFALDRLLDGAPAISGSLVDHRRVAKPAFATVAAACAPTIVVADPPLESIAPRSTLRTRVLVVHDGRQPVTHCRVDARLLIGSDGPVVERSWGGPLEADSVTLIGTLELPLEGATGPVALDLTLTLDDDLPVTSRYEGRIGAD
jgi:beta-mannosidase